MCWKRHQIDRRGLHTSWGWGMPVLRDSWPSGGTCGWQPDCSQEQCWAGRPVSSSRFNGAVLASAGPTIQEVERKVGDSMEDGTMKLNHRRCWPAILAVLAVLGWVLPIVLTLLWGTHRSKINLGISRGTDSSSHAQE